MASEEYLTVLNEFYKLKTTYENTYKEKINKLKKKTSGQDLRNKIKLIKRKCVACKKIGGSIFTINNNILKATCGHLDNPCNLNIELHRGNVMHENEFYNDVKEQENDCKKKIISTKLSLLFGLEDEDVTIKLFEDYKTDLSEALEQLQFWEEKQFKNNSISIEVPQGITVENYMENKNINIETDEKKEEIIIEKKNQIKKKITELEQQIKQYNNNILEFRKDNTKKSLLIDSFLDYSNNIIPIFNEIRKLKYDSVFIEQEKMYTIPNTSATIYKYTMNQIPRIIKNKEIVVDEYKVISKDYM